jgi:VWFA-related protein
MLAQLTVDVNLVTFVATVTDNGGRYVPDLGKDDFLVSEDGKPQKVALVEQSEDPEISIGILLDTSESMQSKIKTATASVDRFITSLGSSDDMFLMTFAAKTKIEQNFTSDRSKISKALKNVKLSRGTVLYDAIEKGVLKLREGKHPKKAILLVTDGQDFGSQISLEQAMDDVRESHVLLYCLGIGAYASSQRGPGLGGPYPDPRDGSKDPPPTNGPDRGRERTPTIPLPGGNQIPFPGGPVILRQFPFPGGGRPGGGRPGGGLPGGGRPGGGRPGGGLPPRGGGQDAADMRVLNSLASASGGRAFLVTTTSINSMRSIDDVLDEISSELRNQYIIGYYPDHPVNDGKWHQVAVQTKNAKFEVRSRKEYFGGESSR